MVHGARGHICENPGPHRDALVALATASIIGALASLLSMAEAGYVRYRGCIGCSPGRKLGHRALDEPPPDKPSAAVRPRARSIGFRIAAAAACSHSRTHTVCSTGGEPRRRCRCWCDRCQAGIDTADDECEHKAPCCEPNDVSLRAMLAHWGVHAAKPSHGWWSWTRLRGAGCPNGC